MTNIKMLGAVAIVAALAAPVLARDGGVLGPGNRDGLTPGPGVTHHIRGRHHDARYRDWSRYRASMASTNRTDRTSPGRCYLPSDGCENYLSN